MRNRVAPLSHFYFLLLQRSHFTLGSQQPVLRLIFSGNLGRRLAAAWASDVIFPKLERATPTVRRVCCRPMYHNEIHKFGMGKVRNLKFGTRVDLG